MRNEKCLLQTSFFIQIRKPRLFLSRRYFHDIRLRKNFRRKFQNCKRKQRKKKKKNNNNVETARIKRRGQEDLPFFFFSREIQLKLRCVCNGERKKVKKKEKKGERSEVTFLSFFTFFLFFSVGNTARDTQTPRVHARNYSPRCYGHILCIPAYTYTALLGMF